MGNVSKWGSFYSFGGSASKNYSVCARHVFSAFRADTAKLSYFGRAECPNFAFLHVFLVGAPRETSSRRRLKNLIAAEVGWVCSEHQQLDKLCQLGRIVNSPAAANAAAAG